MVTSDGECLDGTTIQSLNVLGRRLETKRYPLYERTRLRGKIKEGDICFFYLAGKGEGRHTIIGHSQIDKIEYPKDPLEFNDMLGTPVDRYLKMGKINIYDKRILLHDIKEDLTFIKNKQKWGVYFQGGTIMLQKSDAKLILAKNEVS